MKKVLSLFILLACVFFTKSTYAFFPLSPGKLGQNVHFYGSVKAGANLIFNTHAKNQITGERFNKESVGVPLGLSLGVLYSLGDKTQLRLELEYLYRTQSSFHMNTKYHNSSGTLVDGRVSVSEEIQSLLSILYLDFALSSSFDIYGLIGAGMGRVRVDYETATTGASQQNNEFTWLAGAGMSYAITENLLIDFETRFIQYINKSLEIHDSSSNFLTFPSINGVEALIGFRYLF